MKTLLLILALMCSSSIIFSQENTNMKHNDDDEFGIHIGSTTGMGLSYRHWFNKFGVQVTGLPYKDNHEFFSSAAVTMMYSILKSEHIRVYGYLGNHYTHHKLTVETDWNGSTYLSSTTEITNKWHIGFGPGFSLGTTVAFNIMAGYGIYDITGNLLLLPAGEIGLYVRF